MVPWCSSTQSLSKFPENDWNLKATDILLLKVLQVEIVVSAIHHKREVYIWLNISAWTQSWPARGHATQLFKVCSLFIPPPSQKCIMPCVCVCVSLCVSVDKMSPQRWQYPKSLLFLRTFVFSPLEENSL